MTYPHVVATMNSLGLYHPRDATDGRCIKTTLFAANSGVDKQRAVQRPIVSVEEEKVMNWVLDDRDMTRPMGWDRLVGDANFRAVPVQDNHFSLMKKPYMSDPTSQATPMAWD